MERWQQIESVFQEALQRDPGERDAFVHIARDSGGMAITVVDGAFSNAATATRLTPASASR